MRLIILKKYTIQDYVVWYSGNLKIVDGVSFDNW
jgi:hypothetical protein